MIRIGDALLTRVECLGNCGFVGADPVREALVPEIKIRAQRLRTNQSDNGNKRAQQGVLDQVLALIIANETNEHADSFCVLGYAAVRYGRVPTSCAIPM